MSVPDLRFDHVALAVPDLDVALDFWIGRLGCRLVHRERVVAQGVEVAVVESGCGRLELATGDGVSGFLERRGPGLHHVGFEVVSLAGALAAVGLPPVEPDRRPSAQGRVAAYLHPRTTGGVLVELLEPATGGAGPARRP